MSVDRLYVSPRQHLETVWRHVDERGVVSWQVWTACKNRNAPLHEMYGTFINLHMNGAVTHVTLREDDSVDIQESMPPVGEK